jgi:hypothetical protein
MKLIFLIFAFFIFQSTVFAETSDFSSISIEEFVSDFELISDPSANGSDFYELRYLPYGFSQASNSFPNIDFTKTEVLTTGNISTLDENGISLPIKNHPTKIPCFFGVNRFTSGPNNALYLSLILPRDYIDNQGWVNESGVLAIDMLRNGTELSWVDDDSRDAMVSLLNNNLVDFNGHSNARFIDLLEPVTYSFSMAVNGNGVKTYRIIEKAGTSEILDALIKVSGKTILEVTFVGKYAEGQSVLSQNLTCNFEDQLL